MIFVRTIARINPWVAAICGFVLLVFSISNQSIDMDEAQTWDYAHLRSWPEFMQELRSDANSEAQMPFGMASFWLWCQNFGTGEVAMRSLNVLWLVLALAGMADAAKQTGMRWLPLVFAIQPFVWYCMDQARTPMMQMAGGALILAGACRMLNSSPRKTLAVASIALGALILCGASMLGVVPLATVGLFLLATAAWKKMVLAPGTKIVLLGTLALLSLLGVYYASTLLRGAGGAKLWAVTPLNLIFVGYEFLGYSAVGPGRQELREVLRGMTPASGLAPFVLGWVILSVAYLAIALSAAKSWLTRVECGPRKPSLPVWFLCVWVPLGSAVILFILAKVFGFPFWGRHLAGTIPFVAAAITVILYWAVQGLWRCPGRIGVGMLITLWIAGSAITRLSITHQHDDYRSAAEVALNLVKEGKTVWWVADPSGGEYYGLQLLDRGARGPGAISAVNEEQVPENLPNAIILSRPENFDERGVAQKICSDEKYDKGQTFKAFEVWERPAP